MSPAYIWLKMAKPATDRQIDRQTNRHIFNPALLSLRPGRHFHT